MTEETKAANSGGAQPGSLESSLCTNTRPLKAWSRSTGPYMCAPQARQAWRWISALGSTTFSLSAFLVTLTLSRGTTATWANSAPFGFQHLVQPHTWLWAICDETATSTGSLVQRHRRVPPLKVLEPEAIPLSTAG